MSTGKTSESTGESKSGKKLLTHFDPSALNPKQWPGERVARTLRLLHFADDFIGLVCAYAIAYLLRFGSDPEPLRILFGMTPSGDTTSQYAAFYGLGAGWYIFAIGTALVVLYSLFGLYDGHMRLARTPLLWGLLLSNSIVLVALAVYLYFGRNLWHMRGFLPLVLMLNIPCTWLARRITNALVKRIRLGNRLLYRSVLVGEGKEAEKILERSRKRRLKGHRIIECIATPKTVEDAAAALERAFRRNPRISTVFVIKPTIKREICVALLNTARHANRACVVYSPQFLRFHNPFEYGDVVFGVPLVHYAAPGGAFMPSRFRNAVSRALACAVLALASPVMLAIALAIRLETPGPALFVQERYGMGGRKFRMFKFRTMVVDAEARLASLKTANETDGALFKIRDDPRLTRLGRILRKLSLDELPQLINIARGEMRFVGPRPLPCADMEPYMERWQGSRQSVPAGLTCIWQCAGRSDIGFDAMASLDIWYALNRSWLLDFRIVVRTAWSVIFGSGAY